jgi:hypothetical protein
MRHLQVGKRTVRKTAASVREHQIGRQSFSDVAAFVRISALRCHPKIGQIDASAFVGTYLAKLPGLPGRNKFRLPVTQPR